MAARVNVLDAIRHEARDVEARALELVHVRVTAHAIPGTIAALPLTPERARALEPLVVDLQGLGPVAIADPESERRVEIVVHPRDWIEALMSAGQREAMVTAVWGIPVVRS
jgi:hypothetical protein